MRHRWFIAVLLALAALSGYAAAVRPVLAQSDVLPFQIGDIVTFSFQGGGSRQCRIEELRSYFARCGDPSVRQTSIARPASVLAPPDRSARCHC